MEKIEESPTTTNTKNMNDTMASGATVIKMEDTCVDYTLNIVQKQLLGLHLDNDPKESRIFRKRLQDWSTAFFSLAGIVPIPWLIRRSKPYQAKLYIQNKLEAKIDSLFLDWNQPNHPGGVVGIMDGDRIVYRNVSSSYDDDPIVHLTLNFFFFLL